MIDVHRGRAADRGLPGRHADGHLLRLRTEPVDAPRALPRGARPGAARLDGARDLRLRRALQPAALREHLAAAGAAAASADLDTGRRLGRDLAVVRGDGLRLLLPELLRLQGRPGDHGRVLGGDGQARQGPEPVPRRLPAIHRRRREPRAGDGALPRAGRVLLRPLPARRRALGDAARLHDGGDAARRPAEPGGEGGGQRQHARQGHAGALRRHGQGHGRHRRPRLRADRQPGRGGGAAPRGGEDAQRRPLHAAACSSAT